MYNFPTYRKIPDGMSDRLDQIEKIRSEVWEAEAECSFKGSPIKYIMELWDIVHATETALREFPAPLVDACRKVVIENNRARGYYDDEQ